MILVKTAEKLRAVLADLSAHEEKIGFVPTMGALHPGHLSLLTEAKKENKICVCSIFINPTQFNNATDLAKYPVTIEKDIDLLEGIDCDVLFLPGVVEMYPQGGINKKYDLGYLESVLEGAYRPGHFQGVCTIVDKLISMVRPSALYLGRKDYQQCMVIKKMMKECGHTADLRVCETVREHDGLAMSSRNMRLDATQRAKATAVIEALKKIKANFRQKDIMQLQDEAKGFLHSEGFKVDYIEIADGEILLPYNDEKHTRPAVALAAAFLDEIRLIDNIDL